MSSNCNLPPNERFERFRGFLLPSLHLLRVIRGCADLSVRTRGCLIQPLTNVDPLPQFWCSSSSSGRIFASDASQRHEEDPTLQLQRNPGPRSSCLLSVTWDNRVPKLIWCHHSENPAHFKLIRLIIEEDTSEINLHILSDETSAQVLVKV